MRPVSPHCDPWDAGATEGEKGQVRRIRSCGFPCGAVRPSVGDVDGRRWLCAALAALWGAPFVLLAAGLWAGAGRKDALGPGYQSFRGTLRNSRSVIDGGRAPSSRMAQYMGSGKAMRALSRARPRLMRAGRRCSRRRPHPWRKLSKPRLRRSRSRAR